MFPAVQAEEITFILIHFMMHYHAWAHAKELLGAHGVWV